jgi:hypothetical protein
MKFVGTVIQFEFDPECAGTSARQLALLLEGLGYDQATCVGNGEGKVVVCGVRFFGERSLDRSHEVSAIWGVLGDPVEINYYGLRPLKKSSFAGPLNV